MIDLGAKDVLSAINALPAFRCAGIWNVLLPASNKMDAIGVADFVNPAVANGSVENALFGHVPTCYHQSAQKCPKFKRIWCARRESNTGPADSKSQYLPLFSTC